MFFRPSTPSISVKNLRARLDSEDTPVLLDIRSAHERAHGSLGGVHIEMQSLPGRIDELSAHQEDEIIVYCQSGNRSASVVRFLRANGYARAVNLAGGLVAWSRMNG
ncbi:rhodanese-like domain-containing protein [Rhodothermus sp. AH-315-K08]|nr:rhodanese-like domain-containing protein [Rhodothermus sp. AH-315-K08]